MSSGGLRPGSTLQQQLLRAIPNDLTAAVEKLAVAAVRGECLQPAPAGAACNIRCLSCPGALRTANTLQEDILCIIPSDITPAVE